MRIVALLLALAVTAAAQDAPFTREGISMMPGISNKQRYQLFGIQGKAAKAVARERKTISKIDKQLKSKPKKQAAKKLRKARTESQRKIASLLAGMVKSARDAGFTNEQIARLHAMPNGKLRVQRYNHGVILEAPNLSASQRTLLARVIATTDAAQAAGLVQHEHLVKGLEKEDKLMRRRIDSTCNQQRQLIERRFWRAVHYTLTPGQMRAVRKLYSPGYRGIPQMRQQLFLLPGVTPSQATRLNAIYTERESEAAADQAEVARIRRQIKSGKLSKAENIALQKRNGECYGRLGELNRIMNTAIRETLTPMQRNALDALPPSINIGERGAAPWDTLKNMRVQPAQRARVKALQAQDGQRRKEVYRERKAAQGAMAGAGIGPESPQMMTMKMAEQGARGGVYSLNREAGHELFVEILTPDQVAGWVVAPTLAP